MTVSGRPESSPGDHQPTDQERDLLQRSVKKVRQGFTGTSALVPWVEDWMQEETPELGKGMKTYASMVRGPNMEMEGNPLEDDSLNDSDEDMDSDIEAVPGSTKVKTKDS
ncbi:hypothetical protein S83_015148 [Arachis hypogaea]